jgi:hypothetical protein
METAQLHNKMVQQNPNRWDAEEQGKRYNDYIKTGDYEHPEPPIKPLSLTDAAMRTMNKVATKEYIDPKEAQQTYTIGGVPYKKATVYSAKKEDVIPYIQATIANNDQYAAGALKEWNGLTPQEKEEYHKTNPQNPILEMAVDRHWKEWVKTEEKEQRNIVSTRSGYNLNLFGRDVKFSPGQQKQGTIAYADKTYSNPIEFDGSFKFTNVPTNGGNVLKGQYTKPLSSRGNIEGYLKNYDPERDVFILAATGTDPNVDNGSLMEIPASNLNQTEINKIPIYVNGKPTTIGAIRGQKSTTTATK